MAENLGKRPSKRGPISKIRPLDGRGRDGVLLAVERWYDSPEFACHLGNVDLMNCGKNATPDENNSGYAKNDQESVDLERKGK